MAKCVAFIRENWNIAEGSRSTFKGAGSVCLRTFKGFHYWNKQVFGGSLRSGHSVASLLSPPPPASVAL